MCWTLNSNGRKTQTNEKNDNKNRLYVRISNRNFRIEEGITSNLLRIPWLWPAAMLPLSFEFKFVFYRIHSFQDKNSQFWPSGKENAIINNRRKYIAKAKKSKLPKMKLNQAKKERKIDWKQLKDKKRRKAKKSNLAKFTLAISSVHNFRVGVQWTACGNWEKSSKQILISN